MIELKLKNHVVKICDSIFELTIDKFQEFQKALTLEIHSGTTVADIHAHYSKISEFIQRDMRDEAMEEINNIVAGAYFTLNNMDTTSNAFMYLIDSIDGVDVPAVLDDVETERIKKILSAGKLSQRKCQLILDRVKKKLLTKSENFTHNTTTTATN